MCSADGVILMRQRRPEERHDAIAHDLVHRAFIAMNGGDHAFQHGIKKLASFLGVAVSQQFHGALQIGKQNGDLLA
jgi:hypothetical protein